MKRLIALLAALVLLSGQQVSAALKINEIYYSPEDPKDDRQFFEIISDQGVESLNNVWLLEIDGDSPSGFQSDNPGQVLNAIDLSGFSTGTNGLFLWRDSATVLDNSTAPGVQGPGASGINTAAFHQVLGYEEETEFMGDDVDLFVNAVHSFLLVSNFTGTVPTIPQGGIEVGNGDDLDADNNGTLETTPWSAVLDGVSAKEDGDDGHQYAGQFGGLDFVGPNFGPDVWHRLVAPNAHGEWAFFDSGSGDGEDAGYPGLFFANDGAGPGDSQAAFSDGTEIVVYPTSQFLYATPGGANLTGVPEPSTVMLAAVAAALFGAGVRRRRN